MIHEAIDQKLRPFNASLKDGTDIQIREATIQDATEFIRCVKSYIADGAYQVMEPEEFGPDIGQGREFIQNYLENENSLLILATHNDRIIGNLDITGGRRKRLRHTGLVGMGMLKEYRSRGLGSVLLQTGIKWAQKNPLLEKLWLQIIADNEPAVRLYTKMGFIEEGRQKNFIRVSRDQYHDNLVMALQLKPVLK